MRQRAVPLILLALLAAPLALAHGGVEDEDRYEPSRPARDREPARIPSGYTGPGREPYVSYFQGVWLYGQMSVTPLEGQRPRDMDADGDWLVWEDATRSDIFVFNVPAQQGYYITNDSAPQRHPKVSGNVVVFEDHRSPVRASIYAYFLDTGEYRRLSHANRSTRDPSIDLPIVAWIDENVTNPDVWSYSLLNQTAWNVHPGNDRDSDPVVVRDRIFWRTYRYNLWDIVGYDVDRHEPLQVTTDAAIQSRPFSNGEDLLFLTNHQEVGWKVDKFRIDELELEHLELRLSDTTPTSASGDAALRLAYDLDFAQMVVRNLTNGATNHVSGNLLFTTNPVLEGRTVYAAVRTHEGTSLLTLQVSPFAFAKRPALTISSPASGTSWLRPLPVAGLLTAGTEFTEPTTFTYRIDDQPPQVIPPGTRWRITADPAGLEPGVHSITVRATFREGPPVVTSILLNIPAPSQTIDVERAGPAFHAARLLSELNAYVLDNPASWFLIPLVIVLVAVLVFRLWLWLKPRRRRVVAEYVSPDEA